MNCAQCQAANGPDAAFCGSCGARLAPAPAAAGAGGYPQSSGAPAGDNGPSGYGGSGEPTVLGTPAFHAPPPGAGGSSGYAGSGGSGGSGAPSGYGGPAGNPSGYGGPSGNPSGYGAPSGSGGPSGYGGPGYGPDGYGPPPPGAGYAPPPGPGYGPPPGGQAPNGYPQGQYQPGQSGPAGRRSSGLPPVSFNLARLTRVDRIVGVATLITMISLWLPWYTVRYTVLGATSSGSVSGTHDHGWLWLEFLLALVLIAYIAARAAWEQLPFPQPVAHEVVLIAATGLQFLLILIGFLAKPSVHGYPGYSIGWGFGAYLALIAAIVAGAPVIYPAVKAYLDRRKGGAGAPRGY